MNFLNSPELREGQIKMPKLKGKLSWRDDGQGFHPRVVTLANELGYT